MGHPKTNGSFNCKLTNHGPTINKPADKKTKTLKKNENNKQAASTFALRVIINITVNRTTTKYTFDI